VDFKLVTAENDDLWFSHTYNTINNSLLTQTLRTRYIPTISEYVLTYVLIQITASVQSDIWQTVTRCRAVD